jgi:hypothetical protein
LFASAYLSASDQDYIYAGNYSVGGSADADHIIVENCCFLGKTSSGKMRAQIHAQIFNGSSLNQYWRLCNNSFDGHGTTSSFVNWGFGHREQQSTSTVFLVAINNWCGEFALACLAVTTTPSPGTFTTTGSLTNFDDDNTWPARSAMTYVEGAPATGELGVVSFQDDLSLFDDPDNVGLASGTGPSTEPLVPTTDIIGATRSGTTCDVGAFEVTAAAAGQSHEYIATHVAQRTSVSRLRRM